MKKLLLIAAISITCCIAEAMEQPRKSSKFIKQAPKATEQPLTSQKFFKHLGTYFFLKPEYSNPNLQAMPVDELKALESEVQSLLEIAKKERKRINSRTAIEEKMQQEQLTSYVDAFEMLKPQRDTAYFEVTSLENLLHNIGQAIQEKS